MIGAGFIRSRVHVADQRQVTMPLGCRLLIDTDPATTSASLKA